MRFEVEAFVLQALKPEALTHPAPEQPEFCRESDAWDWAFEFAAQLKGSLTFASGIEKAPWTSEMPLESRTQLEKVLREERRRFVLLDDELEEALGVLV